MNTSRVLLLSSVFLMVIFGVLFLNSHNEYQKYEIINETTERVYADCGCFGQMNVMESSPLQFNCRGISYCEKTNYTRAS